MKKLTIHVLLLFAVVTVQAQFNSSAPWMKDLQQKKSLTGNDSYTFKEITDAFDAYWVDKNPNEKGSGYKPFMRWREHWKNALLENGTLPSSTHLNTAWQQSKAVPEISNNSRSESWKELGLTDYMEAGGWNPGIGRVNVAVVDPNNENIFYVGTPAGGIWKSKDAGNSWQCLSDDYPFMGVSAIAIDPNSYDSNYNESRTIYITTGDDDSSHSYSLGVYKSETAGTDWSETALNFTKGSQNTEVLGRIFIDPVNSDNVWTATTRGIFKLSNGGENVVQKYDGTITDIQMHPTSGYLYFSVSPQGWGNNSPKMFRMNTVTSELTEIAQNKIKGDRISIDVTPLRPDFVYFATISTSHIEIYESNNLGDNFTLIADDDEGRVMPHTGIDKYKNENRERSQLHYNFAFAVSDSSNSPDDFFIGAINVWKGTIGRNGAKTKIDKVNHWDIGKYEEKLKAYTHSDIHYLKYHKGKVLCGSDGGFYISNDNGESFTSLSRNGMQISQFYDVELSRRKNSSSLVGGTQDNGGFAYDNNKWLNYHGGDGLSCLVLENEYSQRDYYGLTQTGTHLYALKNSELENDKPQGKYVWHHKNDETKKGLWKTPLVRNKKGEIFAGYRQLHKLQKIDDKYDFIPTHTDSGYKFSGNASCIEVNPIYDNIMYVAAGENLYKTEDKGATWRLIYTFDKNITSIEVNNDDGNKAYVTLYGWTPEILQTDNINASTVNFYSIKGNNFPNGGINVIKHHRGTETIYVGTFYGIYVKQGNKNWMNYSQSLPDGPVKDIEIDLIDNKIIAATYSRGIWESALIDEKPDVTAPNKPDIEVLDVNYTSVKLSWDDVLKNDDGYYEVETSTNNNIVKPDLELVGNTATLSGLALGTEYQFKVKTFDYYGNLVYSQVNVKTLEDTEPPTIPENFRIETQHIYSDRVSPDWDASTDNFEVLKYEIVVLKDGKELFVEEKSHSTGEYWTMIYDLTANTTYGFKIRAIDTSGNASNYTDTIYVKTSSNPNQDTTAPTVPLNLEASNITETTADLSWEASTDNIGVTGYDVYMNNNLYTTVNTTEANVTGLSKSSGYQFKVKAKDAAGNLSEFSNAVIVETLGDSSDICEGIEEFDPNKNYKIGDRVVSNNYLYEKSYFSWRRIGPCATNGAYGRENTLLENKNLVVIPNPIKNSVLKVEYSAGLDSSYSIYNIIGQEVKSGVFTNTIDVKNLQDGTYILKVMSNNEMHSVRFVK